MPLPSAFSDNSKRKIIFISLILICMRPYQVFADSFKDVHKHQSLEEVDNEYAVREWYGGPYFLLGLGPSVTVTITDDLADCSYGGCHIFTGVGYWAYNVFGIELCAFIDYGYFHDMTVYNFEEISPGLYEKNRTEGIDAHMWSSSFLLSVMFRWPFIEPTDLLNIYMKFFIGYGVGVFWLDDIPASTYAEESDRFFSDGPVFGVAFGNLFNAFNKSTVWYIQLTILTKIYREVIALKDEEILPKQTAEITNVNNTHNIQIHLTVGLRLY